MHIVIKLGGDVLLPPNLEAVARSLARVHERAGASKRIVAVHGGGAQVTATAEALGLTTQMIAGRRVTDEATIGVLKMVVAGQLNVDLCAALQRHGAPAVGLHAGSGVVRASRRPPRVISGGPPTAVDLGLVGDVTGFDVDLLEALWQAGRIPVLSCLGLSGGAVLNVNADLVASRLALALGAQALVAVTGVGGVRRERDDASTRIARLTIAEARAAIATGVVTGGMIPKLEEAFLPLQGGVAAFHIVGPSEIAEALERPGEVGTWLSP